MGAAAAVRERDRPGRSALEQVWSSDPFLGPTGPAQCPDDRSWRQPPDGARSAPRARSRSRVRFRGRRGRHNESRRLDLDLVARRSQVSHRKDGNDPARARSEEHTSELQSLAYLVCRLLLEKKKKKRK